MGITVVAVTNINRVVLEGIHSRDREGMEDTLATNNNSNNRLCPERPRTGLNKLKERREYLLWSMGCRTRRIRAELMRLGRGIGVSILFSSRPPFFLFFNFANGMEMANEPMYSRISS